MRQFINNGSWQHGEKQITEKRSGKSFTLIDPVQLFSEDYYTIRRALAVDNCNAEECGEFDFYVCEFLYMTKGSTLEIKIVDIETAHNFINQYLWMLMHGTALKEIETFFSNLENKE